MLLKLIKTFRPEIIFSFLIVWNVLIGIGIALNGGMGRIQTLSAAAAMAITCAGLSAFGFGTALSSSWQRILPRPEADSSQARPALILIGLIGAGLSIGGIISAIEILGQRA